MRGLVQSGGGVKGAHHMGVLDVLIGKQGREYDFMSGTSVGALNTSMLAQCSKGQIYKGYLKLSEIWDGIRGNEDIWKHWFLLHQVAGLWKDGLYNSGPLWDLIDTNVDEDLIRASGREVRFGVVRYGSGEYYEATDQSDDLKVHIYGSATFPGAFLPKQYKGDLLIDGGARRVTPLKSAIRAGCIEIDVLLSGPRRTEPKSLEDNWLGTKRSALTILMRTLELLMDELFARDIEKCLMVNDLVAVGAAQGKEHIDIRIFEPKEPLLDGALESLEFDPAKIAVMRQKGHDVARDIVAREE